MDNKNAHVSNACLLQVSGDKVNTSLFEKKKKLGSAGIYIYSAINQKVIFHQWYHSKANRSEERLGFICVLFCTLLN